MKKAIITIYIFIIATAAFAANSDYTWPIKLRPELTSRFCDYRAGHFHGGLDIRTGGRIGVPIYAIADGYVFRVATSFRGYGKALYLKLKDDRIVVFGHLSGFIDAVDERVRAAQMKDKRYSQDLYFTSSEIPVKKGQLIAYSGESGTGAPHLHFEMRSPQNNPINPLESGYTMIDKIPPEFDYLAVRYYRHGFNPGDPCEIEFLPVIKKVNGYTITDTIISDDYIALAIAGGDRIDGGSGFFYGYFGLRMSVDDSLLFRMESDSLSYNTTRQLNYVRDLELIRLFANKTKIDNDQGIFYRLYVPPRANQYFWPGFSDNCGVIPPINKPGEVQKIKIEAYDESGNRAQLSFYLKSPELQAPFSISYRQSRDSLLVDFVSLTKVNNAEIQYRGESSQAYKNVRCSILSQSLADKFQNHLRFKAPISNGEYRFSFRDNQNHLSPWVYFHEAAANDKFTLSGSANYLCVKYLAKCSNPTLTITSSNQSLSFPM
ncbi:MAG TPA: hypothetical protein DCZ43_10950, partial [candidate division Zixibacteria bacterium]|nr:hypothetical protein [candidate division Zixibacteria bacterium]